jgi:hypothetical protein
VHAVRKLGRIEFTRSGGAVAQRLVVGDLAHFGGFRTERLAGADRARRGVRGSQRVGRPSDGSRCSSRSG